MPFKDRKYYLLITVFFIFFITLFLFYQDWKSSKQDKLIFAMLDIGQGDGLFIESPTGTQIMFDAGPARSVLGALAGVMSPFDKTIDAIVITNPDADHIGGFLNILKNYKVGIVFESGTFNDSKIYQNLATEIKRQNIPHILVKRGMRLNVGGGAMIDILFPDRDVSTWTTNDGSIVARLSYGNTSMMLTGDATTLTEKIILKENSLAQLKSTILKVGHHGSRSSTSASFVKAVAPMYALISDGKNNKYGHPHKETLNTLDSLGIKISRTDLLGTIIANSDGQNVTFSFHR
mgnify:CR=1 FL=1